MTTRQRCTVKGFARMRDGSKVELTAAGQGPDAETAESNARYELRRDAQEMGAVSSKVTQVTFPDLLGKFFSI